ncbi:sensor domain-containing diguanylate cyclase [Halanaerobium kushneri]|uniref:PAS domain S-box-containing protein/diguanylate cyclase (GGDEF) domain-containing protein n=1 Tax=Halanaerobium kushneri TaxID=56779 RepID=A0A1N6Z189_9FIRM|nr:sensor domain-containing diguanylate cyclase [Halanaerobium kushneri]SIR20491.1 PAS domain S-box-containing protein/diguanylate cyclase (GGDEF) domain-containing protein [Halanaerobium kushneri]
MSKRAVDNLIEKKVNENIVNNLEQKICYYKDPYTYKMANLSYAKFLGKDPGDFLDEDIFNILAAAEAEKVIAENIDIFVDKKIIEKEIWTKNSRGENKLLLIKKIPIFNQTGDVENIFCQAKDITNHNILENELRRNRDSLKRIIETIPDIVFLINKQGDILDLWTGDESKLLYTKEEALNKNLKDFLSQEAFKRYKEKITQLFNQNESVTFDYSLIINESRKYFEAKMLNLKNQPKKPKRIIVSVRDISERKENSLKLKKLSREYETILSNVENAIFLINVESGKFRYQRLNSFHEKATGLKTKEVAGKTPIEIFGEKVGPELEKKYRRCLDKKSSISYEEELTLPAGKRVWLTKLTPVINKGEVEKIVGSSLDITENKKKEREIKYLSLHDEMTELYNRRYFENEMERLDSSRKLPVAILIADLDNLKYVNDNFGHQQGDNYIITAAQMIKESIRGIDIAARIGGDEFALILPETDSDEAEKICNRIKEKESDYLKQKNLIEIFSISIGYAVKKSEEISLEEVFRKADKRMYANKAKNKSKKK